MIVTVAIPVKNGGSLLREVLEAVRGQRLHSGVSLQLLVCDSGSADGSLAVARDAGAEVLSIAPASFSHGGTRNLLMQRAQGERVALLTQDSVPAAEDWLATLLAGFEVAENVGLVFGPYRPRPDASVMVTRELVQWFQSLAPDGQPRVDALDHSEQSVAARALYGARGFFTDANACIDRAAWAAVPFRTVPYAEDHYLAHDMLRAGYRKVFMPEAAVIHSHDYRVREWLRRSFDETRAVQEIYGVEGLSSPRRLINQIRGGVGEDLRWARHHADGRLPQAAVARLLAASLAHHAARAVGTGLGAGAAILPRALARRLSLEGRH